MLTWTTHDTENLPNKVRTRIINVFKVGLNNKSPNGISGRSPLPDRIRGVAIIARNGRHDLYPFTASYTAEAFKVIMNVGQGGCEVDFDFHTEGYPLYHRADTALEPWLHEMMVIGLIDAYVYNDRLDSRAIVYQHGRDGYQIAGRSKYKFYIGTNYKFIPVETWEAQGRGEFDLSECFYEFEENKLIKIGDVGVHYPSAKKKLRRYTVSWLRRKVREDL